MATAKTKAIGRVACFNPKCTEQVIVRENEHGGLNCGCGICDIEVRHKKGTDSHRDCMASMTKIKRAEDETPTPAAKPAPAPAKPAPAKPAPAPPPAPAPAPAPAPTAKKSTNFLGL